MWRKLILGLVIVPLGVLLVALAVVNRTPAQLVLDPFGGNEPSLVLLGPAVSVPARCVRRSA